MEVKIYATNLANKFRPLKPTGMSDQFHSFPTVKLLIAEFISPHKFHTLGSNILSVICARLEEYYLSRKRPLTFNGLHGVMPHRTELFITTSERA
jgi:hypothetical protein